MRRHGTSRLTFVAAPGQLIFSLDFELYWGVHDRLRVDEARGPMLATRRLVPRLLDLLAAAEVSATWATVGLLLHENEESVWAAAPRLRPRYDHPRRDPYRRLAELTRADRPVCFARDLVRRVLSTPGQELGSHTFSHYLCTEPGSDLDSLRADLRAARSAHAAIGQSPRALVFPRNQYRPEHLSVARREGFCCFRGVSPRDGSPAMRPSQLRRAVRWLDAYAHLPGQRRPIGSRASPGDLVNTRADRFLRFNPRGLQAVHLTRVRAELEQAAKTGKTYHLWWHPHNMSTDSQSNLEMLRRLLQFFDRLRDRWGMRSLTMQAAVAQTRPRAA
ncbi:MAG: hypothetical protein B7733_18860 [Myxococcales bacterium FL481]|nr:MAG: hypothetical protein B7733_18860 [Myxococcales bacterium FL481]